MKQKLSEYVAKRVKDEGVSHVFMIPGGGSMFLNDAFSHTPGLKIISNHHEQASAMAAEGYARMKNDLGVCVVTTGPGGTNTLTGLIGAWLDSIPTLFISGQVKYEASLYKYPKQRQVGVQEVDIIGMVKPVSKYAEVVLDPNNIRYQLEKAIYIAKSGRPGPVWLDIPLNVQSAMIDPSKLKGFTIPSPKKASLTTSIKKTIEAISKSKRPVIVAGSGVRSSDGLKEFYSLIDALKIPVVTSISAHDLLWEKHGLYAGRFGAYGNRAGNFAVQNSDLLIILGSTMNLWETGYQHEYFAREAKKIMIDVDPEILNHPAIKPDISIESDIKIFMKEMASKIKTGESEVRRLWLKQCKKWQKQYPIALPEYKKNKKLVNTYYFTDILSDLLKNDEVVVVGNGTAFTGTFQGIKLKKDQRLLANIGCASMGYGLPAAIGAYFASNKKRIVLITGDGSIQMNLQELQTIAHNKIPIKIFVLNNNGYLAIRITQKYFFNRLAGTDSKNGISFPDIQKISKAYGIPSTRISSQTNLSKKLSKVLDMKGPVICEIMMPPNQKLIPKPTTIIKKDGTFLSKPIEDTFPFLDRKEFLSNMFIKPVNEEV